MTNHGIAVLEVIVEWFSLCVPNKTDYPLRPHPIFGRFEQS
jgi:hypothetical protein